jgi:hypothetical protein
VTGDLLDNWHNRLIIVRPRVLCFFRGFFGHRGRRRGTFFFSKRYRSAFHSRKGTDLDLPLINDGADFGRCAKGYIQPPDWSEVSSA